MGMSIDRMMLVDVDVLVKAGIKDRTHQDLIIDKARLLLRSSV